MQLVVVPVVRASDIDSLPMPADPDRWRTLVFCGDELGRCAFTEQESPDEGIPVVTVDEEIYRLLPSLVISTADKFAHAAVAGARCTSCSAASSGAARRHGYRSPDLD